MGLCHPVRKCTWIQTHCKYVDTSVYSFVGSVSYSHSPPLRILHEYMCRVTEHMVVVDIYMYILGVSG